MSFAGRLSAGRRTRPRRLLLGLLAGCTGAMQLMLMPVTVHAVTPTLTINGLDTGGRSFEGIGVSSAGAAVRLLRDYPANQQSDILDFLFKPNFGAGLEGIKAEVGSDINSTWGSEPSIQRAVYSPSLGKPVADTTIDCTRGYEWWLMDQARQRNSSIALNALEWGSPVWIGYDATSAPLGNLWSQDNANYMKSFLDCGASQTNPQSFATVGLENETPNTGYASYIKNNLYPTVHTAYPSTGIVAADLYDPALTPSPWGIATDIHNDTGSPSLKTEVAHVGVHAPEYYGSSTSTAQNLLGESGQTLWDSEEGPATFTSNEDLARIINRQYPHSKITYTGICCTVEGWYSYIYNPGYAQGLIATQQPWTGHYDVHRLLWVVAHTTQFSKVGWLYLDAASGCVGGTGGTGGCDGSPTASYVTMRSTNPTGPQDFSTIIETATATASQQLNFSTSNVNTSTTCTGVTSPCVHVWQTCLNQSSSTLCNGGKGDLEFSHVTDIHVNADGTFTGTFNADSIYTITSTAWGNKGVATYTDPASGSFPSTFSDNFDTDTTDQQPPDFASIDGGWEVQPCWGGRTGKCDQQSVIWNTEVGGSPPQQASNTEMLSVVGEPSANWTSYEVQSDIYMESAGTAELFGNTSINLTPQSNYLLQLSTDGSWDMLRNDNGTYTTILLGTTNVSFTTAAWHTMALKVCNNGTTNTLHFLFDGVDEGSHVDPSITQLGTGSVGLAERPYGASPPLSRAQFDNFSVAPVTC